VSQIVYSGSALVCGVSDDKTEVVMFQEFKSHSFQEWCQRVHAQSGEGAVEGSLSTRTVEGVLVAPLYCRENVEENERSLEERGVVMPRREWEICELLYAENSDSLSRQLLHAAEGEVKHIVVPASSTLKEESVAVAARYDLSALFEIIDLAGLSELRNRQRDAVVLYDPFIALSQEESIGDCYESFFKMGRELPLVDLRPYLEAGADAALQIGIALSIGVEHLRQLESHHGLDCMASPLQFLVAVAGDFFTELSKLRALRRLWWQVTGSCGLREELQQLFVFGQTARWNKASRDVHSNLLRTTTEAFSLIAGGADRIMVSPFDAHLRIPNDESPRWARNIQHLLRYESVLSAIQDPGGGSWYIESLTSELERKGAEWFRDIESRGGMIKASESGWLATTVAKIADQRRSDLARRKHLIVGTSMFAQSDEQPWGSSVGDDVLDSVTSLCSWRAADRYEDLWRRVHRAKKEGRAPFALVLGCGPLKEVKRKMDFALDVIRCADLPLDHQAGVCLEDALARVQTERAKIVVLCASDPEPLLPTFVGALKESGVTSLLVVGKADERESVWREMGVDDFLFRGMDVPTLLNELLIREGV